MGVTINYLELELVEQQTNRYQRLLWYLDVTKIQKHISHELWQDQVTKQKIHGKFKELWITLSAHWPSSIAWYGCIDAIILLLANLGLSWVLKIELFSEIFV